MTYTINTVTPRALRKALEKNMCKLQHCQQPEASIAYFETNRWILIPIRPYARPAIIRSTPANPMPGVTIGTIGIPPL